MAYKYKLIYSDGEVEESEGTYETREEAEDAALYDCSCYKAGGDVLALAGRDYDDGDVNYKIYKA